jgi:hypothetical protein
MWWGRPHEIIVQDVDERGELYDAGVIPNGPPDPERRTFSCHRDNWEAAQELAKAFGWVPRGPLFLGWPQDKRPPIREVEYKPDGWFRGFHQVEADDARAWGLALEACVREVDAGRFELPAVRSAVVLRYGMSLDEYRQANRGLTVQFLRSFAAWLARGPFKFGWDE